MKKFLVLLLGLTIVMTFMPMVGWADSEPGQEPETVCELFACDSTEDLTWDDCNNLVDGESRYIVFVTHTDDVVSGTDVYRGPLENIKAYDITGANDDEDLLKKLLNEKNNVIGEDIKLVTDTDGYVKYEVTGLADGWKYLLRYDDGKKVIGDIIINLYGDDEDDEEAEEESYKSKIVNYGNLEVSISASPTNEKLSFFASPGDLTIIGVKGYESFEKDSQGYGYGGVDDQVIGKFTQKIDNFVTITSITPHEGSNEYEYKIGFIGDSYPTLGRMRVLIGKDDEVTGYLNIDTSIGIKYDAKAVKGLYNYNISNLTILDKGEYILNDKSMLVSSQDGSAEYEGLGSVEYEDSEAIAPGERVFLDIQLKDGYVVDDIKINGSSTNYAVTNNYYYEVYKGNKRVTPDDYKMSVFGYDARDPYKCLLWVPNMMKGSNEIACCGGNDVSSKTDNPLASISQIFANNLRTQLLANVICYSIPVEKNTDGEYDPSTIQIITKKIENPSGTDVVMYDENGNDAIALSKEEAPQASVTNYNTGISNYYGSNLEIRNAYDLSISGGLKSSENKLVTVVIPDEGAKNRGDKVVFIDENGIPVEMETSYTEDGDGVIFRTNHFSEYGVVSKKETPHYYGGAFLPVTTKTDATETDVQEASKAAEKIIAGVEATKVKAKSKLVKTKNGKKGIKITWTKSKGYKVDYYQILRSTKKESGYKKVFQTVDGNKTSYINTKNIKKGKTYYYKVRGVRVVDGEKIYTEWSTNAHRTVK